MEQQNKILRLHNKGNNSHSDWGTRGVYGKQEIAEDIEDPSKGSRKEITSIPSPFARLHLFESAFDSVALKAEKSYATLDETDAYHQLVSDALDVAEIFFHFDEYQNTGRRLEIIRWNKESEIQKLEKNPKHTLLAKTLRLYLRQDTKRTNFDEVSDFYIITCDYHVIGGTSPSTLFFAAHNENFRLAALNLGEGDDLFFDKIPCPLYKRNPKFIRYLFSLFHFNEGLKRKMASFHRYLEANKKALEKHRIDVYRNIQGIGNDYTQQMYEAEFVEAEENKGKNNFIKILGEISYRRLKPDSIDLSADPFTIKPSRKNLPGKTPFALQSNFSRSLDYVGGKWRQGTHVPSYDPKRMEERTLPSTNRLHPYLTISDLLEPTIMRVPYPLDDDKFFSGKNNLTKSTRKNDGKVDVPGEDAYLLPLTTTFFDYFDIDYLQKNTPDGRSILSVMSSSEGLLVSLLIEINSGDYILYERLYENNIQPDIQNNKGAIADCKIDMGLYPLSYSESKESKSRLVRQMAILLDGDVTPNTKHRTYSAKFFDENNKVLTNHKKNEGLEYEVIRHDKQKGGRNTSLFYKINQYYDYIQIEGGGNKGVMLPKWKMLINGGEPVKIAVDFGTTNSFAAVKIGGKEPEAISVDFNNRLLSTYSDNVDHSNGLKESIFRTFMGYVIGKGQDYFLPVRSIVTEQNGLDHNTAKSEAQISAAFLVEQKLPYTNEKLFSNLKWSKITDEGGKINEKRVKSFLSVLLNLARNYVAQNNGALNNVEIIWTYPSSMSSSNIKQFNEIWAELGKVVFAEKVDVRSLSEAVAPYYSWSNNQIRSGTYPVLNLDIGGGTTDVIIFKNGKPSFSTSFRFAGNAIFGSGYEGYLSTENGLLQIFRPFFDDWFKSYQGTIYNLSELYLGEGGVNSLGAADINSFLFSLENSPEVLENRIDPISYTKLLRQKEDVKVGFLIFYTAIIYHLAKMMKAIGLEMPRQIALSGKGSGIVKILDPDPRQSAIAGLTKLIFEKIYDKSYHSDGLDILMGENSKERTCYGALKSGSDQIEVENIVFISDEKLLRYKDDLPAGITLRYKDISDAHLLDIIEKEVRGYFDFFFELDTSFNFSTKFGALRGDRLKALRPVLESDIRHNILQGVKLHMDTVDQEDFVTDALFFYPLVGASHQLLNHIAES